MRGMRKLRSVGFDAATMREAFRGHGQDTREWSSMGTVGFNDGEPLFFDVDQGCPMVKVILHPSFRKVYCRVGAPADQTTGSGEGSWGPFVENDEVLVSFPSGDAKDGAVITHRFNNQIDAFPMDSVAGQDPTTNSFAFKRRRTPYIEEVAGPWMVRHAPSGAFINISKEGVLTLKDGENSALQISPDVIGFAGPQSETSPPEFVLQLDLVNRHFVLQVGDAILTLSASNATPEVNTITVPGAMSIGTLANPPLEHVATTEAVANIISNAFITFAALVSPIGVPLTGSALATAIGGWLTSPAYAATFAAAATGPTSELNSQVLAAITAAFAASIQKPNTPTGQLFPGIGSPGLLIG